MVVGHDQTPVMEFLDVIYTAGRVFDRLTADREASRRFLMSGDHHGLPRRFDLMLLRDLRAISTVVLARRHQPLDADFVRSLNATLTRTAAPNPGRFRLAAQDIGFRTPHGRHVPPTQTASTLQRLLKEAVTGEDALEDALELFLQLTTAQPFEDGNRRTALFAANALLRAQRRHDILTVPHDDSDPALASEFNNRLIHAHRPGEGDRLKDLLRAHGVKHLHALHPADIE